MNNMKTKISTNRITQIVVNRILCVGDSKNDLFTAKVIYGTGKTDAALLPLLFAKENVAQDLCDALKPTIGHRFDKFAKSHATIEAVKRFAPSATTFKITK